MKKVTNSFLPHKLELRRYVLDQIPKQQVKILDAFSGNGILWNTISDETTKTLSILRIEAKSNRKGLYLRGDNMKFFPTLNLNQFDIIDLDTYGSAFDQLRAIFNSDYTGYVICTYIQSVFKRLNESFLLDLGYTENIIRKAPELFGYNSIEKMLHWLALYGVDEIRGYFFDRKNYFYFYRKGKQK